MTTAQALPSAKELALKNGVHYPNESADYRRARNELLAEEIELRRHIERVAQQRRELPPGGMLPKDYTFEGEDGPVRLSELFAGKQTLAIYSYMFGPQRKQPCPMCTSLLSAWDGEAEDVMQRIALVVVARSPIERLLAFKKERGWRHLLLYSDVRGDYTRDYVSAQDADEPAFNVFTQRDGSMRHFWSGEMGMATADPGQDPRGAPDLSRCGPSWTARPKAAARTGTRNSVIPNPDNWFEASGITGDLSTTPASATFMRSGYSDAGRCTFTSAHINRKPDLPDIISIEQLSKVYASGFEALKSVDLNIRRGEIFALLGPNGAGKTTLINIVCGIVRPSSGRVTADGHDIVHDYRAARAKIGLVPQELSTDAFETVWATVNFSRGLFGKPANPAHIEKVLRDLSLWDKKDSKIMTLSGGMKRRVLIAKALSHEPTILFLDEPTAGVDVELRRDMWQMVRDLRSSGVTIILTTHYIEEAEEMADRIGVISKGELILVEDKAVLMRKLGKKQLSLQLQAPLQHIPQALAGLPLALEGEGHTLVYTFDTQSEETGIAALLKQLAELGIDFKDLHSSESSLEDIFVSLVHADKPAAMKEAA